MTWDREHEGQWIRAADPTQPHWTPGPRVMVLGLNCGPAGPMLNMLLHEMAHLIEIDDRRAGLPGFGLITDGVDVSLAPTQRECRVAGIQGQLRALLGLPSISWRALVNGFNFLPGFFLVPGRSDDQRLTWCADQVQLHAARWPVERVRSEWTRKLALVELALR